MTDTLEVAGYVAARVGDLTHEERIRLQKVLYYADGWSLAWTGRRLINDDEFEAWREGPVLRRVYESAIKRVERLVPAQQAIVDAVLRFYGNLSGQELTDATHDEEPWVEARAGLPAGAASDRRISPATMRRYFVAQSISGAAGPHRPIEVGQVADPDAVRATVGRVEQRWSEALDELADR